jgi:uncharacterized protein (TIGR03437 family)
MRRPPPRPWNIRMLRLAAILCLANLIVSAQPAINPGGIVNAASFALPGLQHSSIAQGSIFAIFGLRLAATEQRAITFPLPTDQGLGGTAVRIEVSGLQFFYAPMLYVSPGQLIAVMPSAVPADRTVYLSVITAEGQSASVPLVVVRQSFGIFSSNANGMGPGAIQNYLNGLLPENTLLSPARPGQAVVIWGTGLGPISGNDALPPASGDNPPGGAQVFVSGKPAAVTYQGRSSYAGLDQINIVVPSGVSGCYVPVVVRVGNTVSNTVTMAVSPDGAACSDPLSFSSADLATAQSSTQSVTLGAVKLKRVQSGGAVADSGTGWFATYSLAEIRFSRGLFAVPSLGGCVVDQFRGAEFQPAEGFLPTALLSAGSSLGVTPSGGVQRQILNQSNIYSGPLGGGELPPFLNPGSFGIANQFTVPGQPLPQVLPFSATLDIPSGVKWTNPPGSVSRAQDLTITWTGGDAALEYVQITGYSAVGGGNVGAGFVCSAPAVPGSFTVPAAVLAALPAGAGKLQVGAVALPAAHRLQAPNSSLNALYLSYSISEVRDVNYAQ